ncbi:MAG: cell division protein FtsA [Halothiobacillus sp. 24-54-40]|jgi:cell division protein FtsA|nr:MAG: cell division protein FtsA [Halothiobacillus sp. 20-53-49]OYY33317.1 MAG: cell division protein FtsA [Halothiobacillus sp. 35-54-62]OYZ86881.1 MAG: cell division protein FtsA [Halothiobacillus sp. 24-54-40]OZA79564.1 MAG: cell division protein FtsA [Halothiobacillus sp. 39-53-45]
MAIAIRKGERDLVVGLDVGTTKVAALVGEYDADGHLSLIGFGQSATNKGLRRGSVVDIESTSLAIQRAIDAAGAMSNCEIGSVWVGVAGDHVISMDSKGMTGTAGREITAADIHQVVQSARAVKIPDGQQILYCEAQEFRIDGQDGIRKPQGMTGHRLEADVHIVTTAINNVQNIVKCVERCGLSVTGTVLDPIAAATAVLNEDEKELGVALVDIGGGTTDIAIYTRGALRYTSVLPIAGEQITNDLAYGLTTPPSHAEEIKRKFANLLPLDERAQLEEIEVPGVSGRQPRRISRDTMMRICRPRVEEILGYVQEAIRRSGYHEMINAGVVLTGGTAAMPGLVELTEDFLQMPTRLGLPQGMSGNHEALKNPANATGIGLILHGRKAEALGQIAPPASAQGEAVINQLKRWWKDHF